MIIMKTNYTISELEDILKNLSQQQKEWKAILPISYKELMKISNPYEGQYVKVMDETRNNLLLYYGYANGQWICFSKIEIDYEEAWKELKLIVKNDDLIKNIINHLEKIYSKVKY